ncbi:MAG: hypothetical protein K2J83_04650 [Clostridia bacterium]|nr:hypothetical protein [Clostridia bacterium]
MSISVNLDDAFERAENINVYNEGAITSYAAGTKSFNKILACWVDMINNAHIMPAFGVSLDGCTIKAIQSGLWVEFDFGQRLESGEMPYEKLLIQVARGFSGFNLIRYNSVGGYDGRCFYYDLNGKNMDELYDLLFKI